MSWPCQYCNNHWINYPPKTTNGVGHGSAGISTCTKSTRRNRTQFSVHPERLPTETQLLPNYPNPFNPETWIPFQLNQDAEVRLTIYDVTGKTIRKMKMQLGHLTAGSYSQTEKAIYWDGKTETGEQVGSGTYFYQLQAGDYTGTRKMVILK